MTREYMLLANVSLLAMGLLAVAALAAEPAAKAPAAAVKAGQAGDVTTLDNGLLIVRYDARERVLRVERRGGVFLTRCTLWPEAAADNAAVKIVDCPGPLGAGKGVEVRSPAGSQAVWLVAGSPFAFTRITINNAGSEPRTFTNVTPLAAAVDAGPPAGLKLFGCDGLAKAEQGKTSYSFLALADPRTRAGIVGGWLTHDRGSGIVSAAAKEGALALEARSEYGRLLIAPGKSAEGETFAVGWFDDALAGLEAYADAVARANAIALKRPPSGYCTWYHAGALDEKRMVELAKFCRDQRLKDFGFDFLQIDDGWQVGKRDYTAHNPKGKYAGGMKATADAVRAAGLTAGLWFIPFGWEVKAPAMAGHPDWFVHTADGQVCSVKWAGDCLDMSHPEARRFLAGVVGRMTNEWGYKYLKIDGLWSGMAVKILYPSPAYRDDGLGDAVFHDPARTNVEVYRDGLKLVREAAGPDVYILGCNIAQNMRTMGGSFGLVDGMRIGADIGASWKSITGTAVPQAARLYFLNGRVWANDPDCLMLRDPLTLDEARAWGSLIALSGSLNVVSEWLPGLPPEKLDVVRRTMPNTGRCGRPVDLFERPLAQVWHLGAGEGELRRDIVGIFQWDDTQVARINVDVTKLGLPAAEGLEYVGFDYWENKFLPPFPGRWDFEIRAGSCRILSLVKAAGRPQLVSTSRHVTQGLVDVTALEWDAAKSTLAGKSRVIAGDPYELRIVGGGYRAGAAAVSEADLAAGVAAAPREDGANVRVVIRSPVTREVAWQVTFTK